MLLLAFFGAIAALLLLIIRFRVNPFLALLITAIGTGFAVGMPVREIGRTVSAGFGDTLGSVGIVIGLGVILGQVLVETRATEEIATRVLSWTGERRAVLAVNLTGYLASIPVFMDAAFVIFLPLVRQIASRTGIAWATFVTSLAVGLIATHAMAIPTPGPLSVAANLKLDTGVFLLYGLLISLPAALVGGCVYGQWAGGRVRADTDPTVPVVAAADEAEIVEDLTPRPSGTIALWVLLLPVALILGGSVLKLRVDEGSPVSSIASFAGDKNIALLAGVIFAFAALRRFLTRPAGAVIDQAAAAAGMILLITGAGGAFGAVIRASGIGDYLVQTLTGWNVSVVVLGFVLSALLRGAQGSTTVALVTVSAILGGSIPASGVSPVLVGLAICAGGMCASLPNDSGFWVVSRFGGLSVRDTLRCWTMGGTVAGVTALLLILVLERFAAALPGLGAGG